MKKLFTLSFILISGIALTIANPRNFPSISNGHNNQTSSSNNNSHSSNNDSNNHNNNNNGNHQGNNNNHGPNNNHGSNNHNNNHGSNHNSHGNHYNNYLHPRPVVVYNPRPVIVPRPVYNPRPVIHVNVNRPQPVYVNNTPSYQGFNFKDFMYTLDNQKFDSDRLSIARQALNNNYFDSYQIREVMSVMNFEKTRVEFAKDAYRNCLDKQNYFRVNDAFEFSSSIRELEDYIFASR